MNTPLFSKHVILEINLKSKGSLQQDHGGNTMAGFPLAIELGTHYGAQSNQGCFSKKIK